MKIRFDCLFVLILLPLVQFACIKEYDYGLSSLPEATSSGENTLGCVINDSTYIPYFYTGWRRNFRFVSSYSEYDSSYTLKTLNTKHFNYINHVELHIKKVHRTGEYPIYDDIHDLTYGSPNAICYYRSLPGEGYCNFWLDSTLNENKVKITNFDLVNKTISGTFEFTAVSHDSIDTVHVTDGRFDSRWISQ